MAMNKAPGNQGISSNKLIRPPVRTGLQTKALLRVMRRRLGTALGDHTTEASRPATAAIRCTRKALQTPSIGNELALNSMSPPGQGRTHTSHRHASQFTAQSIQAIASVVGIR